MLSGWMSRWLSICLLQWIHCCLIHMLYKTYFYMLSGWMSCWLSFCLQNGSTAALFTHFIKPTFTCSVVECPAGYPFAYYNGSYCCQTNQEKSYATQGEGTQQYPAMKQKREKIRQVYSVCAIYSFFFKVQCNANYLIGKQYRTKRNRPTKIIGKSHLTSMQYGSKYFAFNLLLILCWTYNLLACASGIHAYFNNSHADS